MITLHCVLALVAKKDMELVQMDVKTTSLHGDLHEDIYMQQSEGFVVKGKEHLVCKLKKSLYGLQTRLPLSSTRRATLKRLAIDAMTNKARVSSERLAKTLEYSLEPEISDVGPSPPLTDSLLKGSDKLCQEKKYANYFLDDRYLLYKGRFCVPTLRF
ncbi:hypothetical protein L7F22_022451 [Adiantum nelumboides]|nr:hypothetical protein [Adiantum nelumboides]